MNGKVFCTSCGAEVDTQAKFCPECGSAQEAAPAPEPEAPTAPAHTEVMTPAPAEGEPSPLAEEPAVEEEEVSAPAPPPPPPPPPPPGPAGSAVPASGGRFEQAAPGAEDLARQLAAQASTPGVALAGLAALITAGAMLVLGLILAVALPDESLLNLGTEDGSTIKEAFRQASGFTLAGIKFEGVDFTFRLTPAIFGPLLMAVAGAAVALLVPALPGAGSLSARSRVAWAAGTGIPMAFAFLVFALISKESRDGTDIEFALGSVFLLALMWGALGGSLGALWSLRRDGRLAELGTPPPWLRIGGGVVGGALKPLGLLLAGLAVLGTAVWVVQTFRDAGEIKSPSSIAGGFEERSTLGATIDHVLYIGDHGVHFAELGSAAEFHAPVDGSRGMPIPVTKVGDVVKPDFGGSFEGEDTLTPTGSFRIFDYSGALPVYFFVPVLGLIGMVMLLALYAGFLVSRSRGTTDPAAGAGWGALVGPVWAVTMVVLNALVQKDVMGKADGDSVFVMFLLGGAVLGAIGGLLAAQAAGPATGSPFETTEPPPPPPPPTAA